MESKLYFKGRAQLATYDEITAHAELRLRGRAGRYDQDGRTWGTQWWDDDAGRWTRRKPAIVVEHERLLRDRLRALDEQFCPRCHHTKACDAARGGVCGGEVDFLAHDCPT